MDLSNHDILKLALVWLIPGLPAITLHECAHGWMALRCGDTTARDRGRLSLNPLRHVDPVGTLIVPGLMLLAHIPFIFGWAKPVPVDFNRLRNRRLGTFLVALAGPLANLLMMCGWLALAWLVAASTAEPEISPHSTVALLGEVSLFGAGINLVLMLLNLIPIPPLDGGRILGALLPEALSRPYMRLERFGILILLILIVTGVFRTAFEPLLEFFFTRLGLS